MKLTQDIHKAAAEALAEQPVTVPRAQYEALMAAADWIRVLHPLTGSDVLDNLRATGIDLEDKP